MVDELAFHRLVKRVEELEATQAQTLNAIDRLTSIVERLTLAIVSGLKHITGAAC